MMDIEGKFNVQRENDDIFLLMFGNTVEESVHSVWNNEEDADIMADYLRTLPDSYTDVWVMRASVYYLV